jgi:hypothetical protein
MNKIFTIISFCFLSFTLSAQTGSIKGKVLDKSNNEPVLFAPVTIQGTALGALSNDSGYFEISGLKPGLYNLQVEFAGFKKWIQYEVEVSNARSAFVVVALEPNAVEGKVLEITTSNIVNQDESPISVRSIGANEIKRNPGGNRDISRAIRSLPGVAAIPSFRNDHSRRSIERESILHRWHRDSQYQSLCYTRSERRTGGDDQCGFDQQSAVLFRRFPCYARQCLEFCF